MLEEFDAFPSVLTIYMTAQMYDALDDLATISRLPSTNLFERFVSWSRRPATSSRSGKRRDFVAAPPTNLQIKAAA
ncbi:hypothetical protein [Actinoplanes sp. URMC 104]|uniref:hypothetical protein n=1 Tax=Actinoplanes sp. URMC 104 TaxID=3423409 RepID=UPI003F1A0977